MYRSMMAILGVLAAGSFARACNQCETFRLEPASTEAKAPLTTETARMKKQRETAEAVWAELQKHVKLVPGKNWPADLDTTIAFEVVPMIGKSKYNAQASLMRDSKRQLIVKDGKFQPLVRITYSYIEMMGEDENAVALVLGHELGHHALGHTMPSSSYDPPALEMATSQRNEANADLFGARLMLKAGYSLRDAVRAEWRGLDRTGLISSSATSTCQTHPADSDRVARLAAILDKGDEQLWRAMAAFENGAVFLAVENYGAAEKCFERVVREFPNCPEALANLGLARLMKYCEGLAAPDIQQLGIGHFLGSTYYKTAASLPSTRSDLAGRLKLWQSAELALKHARDLSPKSPVILANLGIAYLVHPEGKDVGAALECFTEAEKALAGSTLSSRLRVQLLVNFGVAALADGQRGKGQRCLEQAAALAGQTYGERSAWPLEVRSAIAYNTAAAIAGTDPSSAAEALVEYLEAAPKTSIWWPTAYQQYEKLCHALQVPPVPKGKLGHEVSLRKQMSIDLGGGKSVHIGEALPEVLDRLGKPTRETRVRASLTRLVYEDLGIEIITDGDVIFTIEIVTPRIPALEVHEAGVSSKKLSELKVGMNREDIEKRIGPGNQKPIFSAKKEYPYYPQLGLALEYDEAGQLVRIILVQLP
jgi:tetratricopeptide (TPR) repeat protein